MQKFFWVRITKWQKNLVTAALESGADALILPKGHAKQVKNLGRIQVIAPDGDLKLGKDVKEFFITSSVDEDEAAHEQGRIPIIIKNKDWTIIPLENLLAKTKNIIQTVGNPRQAKLALETMEKGADGIVLETKKVNDIIETGHIVRKANNEHLSLIKAKIVSTEDVGMADRVCVDTVALLAPGSGVLAGNSSGGMFLVHNENVENKYVNARPFRINVGAVHAYIRQPGGRTSYLSEMRAGAKVLIIDKRGNTYPIAVGRAKVEKRPMLLIKAKSGNKKIALIMQNAETIRLTRPSGKPISVVKLKKGNEVLAYTEEAGRHFGMRVKESISEY